MIKQQIKIVDLVLSWCLYKNDIKLFATLETFKTQLTKINRGHIEFIREYINRNGSLPPIPLFTAKFPGYTLVDEDQLPKERNDVTCIFKEEAVKDYLLYPMMGEVGKKMLESPTAAIEFIKKTIADFNIEGTIQATDFFGEVDKRKAVTKILDVSNGIPTGLAFLDEYLKGWQPNGDLILFVARTGVGKSMLACNSAIAAVEAGYRVGMYSGEISYPYLAKRLHAFKHHNQPNDLTSEEYNALVDKDSKMKGKLFLLTMDNFQGFPTANDLDMFILDYNLDLLIVDQLSLVKDIDRQPGDPIRIGYQNITKRLMATSLIRGVPIILPVQANREATSQKGKPNAGGVLQLNHISESDGASHFATRVVGWEKVDSGYLMSILKNRYGVDDKTCLYEAFFGTGVIRPINHVPKF